MRRYLLHVGLLSLLLFVVFPVAAFAHESAGASTVIIHIDQNGYSPQQITVTPGTTVEFENTDTELHWPASDDHPSHTGYDGTTLEEHCHTHATDVFDACDGIAPGGTWQFTFEKTGVFEYHDHLWPQLTGSIIVEQQQSRFFTFFVEPVQTFLKRLRNIFGVQNDTPALRAAAERNNKLLTSLKKKYSDVVQTQDPREAIYALQQESDQDPEVAAFCHDVLHEIGHTAYTKYGGFQAAVQYQTDFCNSGYIHGLFESYFVQTPDPLTGLTEICTSYASGGRPFDLWQCHHGIGHGLMYLTGGDVEESLTLCAQHVAEAAEDCKNGVYMEVFNAEILAKEKDLVDSSKPWQLCEARGTDAWDCYMYSAVYLSSVQRMDFAEVITTCDAIDPSYKNACIYGASAEAIKRNMDNAEPVFALCTKMNNAEDQQSCVGGIVSTYMNQKGSATAAKEICRVSPQAFRAQCNTLMNEKEPFFTHQSQ